MIIIKQKKYSEGKNTKDVRKKTDKKDKLIHTTNGAITGAALGGAAGSFLGNTGKGAIIGAGIGAADAFLKDHSAEIRRKGLKESKKPTKPKEVDKIQPGALGTTIGAGVAGYAGKVAAESLHKQRSLNKAQKVIDKVQEKVANGTATASEVEALNALRGRTAEAAEWVLNKTRKRRKVAGAIAGAIAAGSVIGSVAYDKHKTKKLKEAYEKDKEATKQKEYSSEDQSLLHSKEKIYTKLKETRIGVGYLNDAMGKNQAERVFKKINSQIDKDSEQGKSEEEIIKNARKAGKRTVLVDELPEPVAKSAGKAAIAGGISYLGLRNSGGINNLMRSKYGVELPKNVVSALEKHKGKVTAGVMATAAIPGLYKTYKKSKKKVDAAKNAGERVAKTRLKISKES